MAASAGSSSLSRYAIPRQPGVDLWNDSRSRDFCNSFWGPTDAGVNILFARMRFAAKTTDELRNFWRERSLIEDEYANKLANLARMSVGKDEIGELRNSLDSLLMETEKQAATHLLLATQIRTELEQPTTAFFNKQVDHRRTKQAPVERRFKAKQAQETYMVKAREKYEGDCRRIELYQQQSAATSGKDLERVLTKLERAQQTVQANEKDYAGFAQGLAELLPAWEEEWKDYCDSCQDLEEERLDFMKDALWAYANGVSTLCVADDQSCERIRTMLDQLEPEKDVLNFVTEYGTGNAVPEAPKIVSGQTPLDVGEDASHVSDYERISARPAPEYVQPPPDPAPESQPPAPVQPTVQAPPFQPPPAPPVDQLPNGVPEERAITPPPPPAPLAPPPNINGSGNNIPRNSARMSQPLPVPGLQTPSQPMPIRTPSPPPETGPGSNVLFYVKALYDYIATIDEEFDFQAGDVIAVTATPDDGWWSGELLDEARREEGRHIFPSNFVCLF